MGIIKQLDKRTGITYVYESKAYWDKEKKQSRAKRTLIGRIDPETGEMVPTDGRHKHDRWYKFPLWVMYAINHAYFLGFIVRGWALFAYTAESSHSHNNNWIFRIVAALPALAAVSQILSTPWTSAIYTIAEDGYHSCSLYKTIYFSTYFYIIISLIIVVSNWGKLSRRMKAGLFSFNLILLFGIIIRKQFYHMLVTSYFSILAILIIYLTSENPDLYRNNRTRLLNKDALDLIGRDYWERKEPFSLITMAIHNYEESKSIYGINQVNDGLKAIAAWLVKNYHKYYILHEKWKFHPSDQRTSA